MNFRQYDQTDLELLKRSGMSWSRSDYGLMGECEFFMRDKERYPTMPEDVLRLMHILIGRARLAHEREGTPCPWNDEYERVVRPFNLQGHILAFLSEKGRSKMRDIQEAMSMRNYGGSSTQKSVSYLKTSGKIDSPDVATYEINPAGLQMLEDLIHGAPVVGEEAAS